MAEITMRQAIHDALRDEMLRDEKVFLLGEDLGVFGGCFNVTCGLLDEFGPDRVMDTPISEGGFTGMAVGAALAGYRPVVEIMFGDFLTCAMDAIANQAAKQRFMMGGQVSVPLVIRTAEGSGTGAAAQHSQSLEAWFCHVPGLKVLTPSGAYSAKGLLKAAIRYDGPVMFFEHKLCYDLTEDVPQDDYVLPIGTAAVLREGADITLVSYSQAVHKCMQAAAQLEQEGISAEVIDLRTLSPLDHNSIIRSVQKTGRLLTIHEAVLKFGVGAEVSAVVAGSDAFFSLKCPIARLGGADMPIPFNAALEQQCIPQASDIYTLAKQMVKSGKTVYNKGE